MTSVSIVQENIINACARAGRDPSEVTLIAVSKTQPISKIQEVYDAGIRQFGENKVQELVQKKETLPEDISWHMIGHLQRNKVRAVLSEDVLFHSGDSMRLLEALNAEAQKQKIHVSLLLEVNIAEEKSKFGFLESQVDLAIDYLSQCAFLHCKGLMTIAPYVPNPESNRIIFNKLSKLAVDIRDKNIDNIDMSILSMGMSNDYEVAVEEGATLVRVGTAVFGERNNTH